MSFYFLRHPLFGFSLETRCLRTRVSPFFLVVFNPSLMFRPYSSCFCGRRKRKTWASTLWDQKRVFRTLETPDSSMRNHCWPDTISILAPLRKCIWRELRYNGKYSPNKRIWIFKTFCKENHNLQSFNLLLLFSSNDSKTFLDCENRLKTWRFAFRKVIFTLSQIYPTIAQYCSFWLLNSGNVHGNEWTRKVWYMDVG